MWSDREAENDCLGYTTYVSVLAEICTLKDLAPLTLGIFGSWGSGKTSLMRMLKRRVDETAGAKCRTLWFNAWRYEGREEAQSALIHAILAKLTEGKTLAQDTLDVLKRLKDGASVLKLAKFIGKSAITLTPDISGFIDCFREESEKVAATMEQFDRDFETFLKKMEVERVVVFIDDLDRCSSAKVIETFETIKLFLNTPACTFVIGADAEKIAHAVGDVYRVTDAQTQKDYLEKIVQVPFTIPSQGLQDIACYVGMLVVSRHLSDGAWKELSAARAGFYAGACEVGEAIRTWASDNSMLFDGRVEAVRNDLDEIMPYVQILARGLRGNPRQIKRFLNILSLRRRIAAANALKVQQDLLVKMTVLEYVWTNFFNNVVETIDPVTGRSELIAEMLTEKKADGDSKLVSESLQEAGLLEYLRHEPALDGEIDLNPYLVLAQTSLSRAQPAALLPADENARLLVRNIASDDPLRSKAGGRSAAAAEPAVATTVVRSLLSELATHQDTGIRTHILNGLSTICAKHVDLYPTTVNALAQFDAGGKDAVALAASSLLRAAAKANVAVSDELLERFTKQSPLTAALAPDKSKTSRKRF